jgi:ferredoxin
MKKKKGRTLTRSQLERKVADDHCTGCREVQVALDACVECPHKERAYPKLTLLDDPEQLSRNSDEMSFS